MKILLVEDDPVARAVMAKILSGHPEVRLTSAEDGEVAWRLLDDPNRFFDLVLLDLSLPKIDGFGVLERLRGNPLTRNLSVVLCTASHDRATVIRAVALGVRHYLVKPCTEATVFAKLAQLGLSPPPPPGTSMISAPPPPSPAAEPPVALPPAPLPEAAASAPEPVPESAPAPESAAVPAGT